MYLFYFVLCNFIYIKKQKLVVSNFTNVSRDFPFSPDDPYTRYVGNSFLITWWQCYL